MNDAEAKFWGFLVFAVIVVAAVWIAWISYEGTGEE